MGNTMIIYMCKKTYADRKATILTKTADIICDAVSIILFLEIKEKSPAIKNPNKGKNTIA